MKRIAVIILLSLAAIVLFAPSSVAATYTVTQLTNNTYPDGHHFIKDLEPRMSASGKAVWIGGYNIANDAYQEIFFFNGTSVIQLTNNDYVDSWPQVNAGGQVVWMGRVGSHWQIFLYDGTSV